MIKHIETIDNFVRKTRYLKFDKNKFNACITEFCKYLRSCNFKKYNEIADYIEMTGDVEKIIEFENKRLDILF
jgi:hypothetical protein